MSTGLKRETILSEKFVLPAVRKAVDSYVHFAKTSPWQEGICSSLTELFAGEAHQKRLVVFQEFYPWIKKAGIDYCERRIIRVQHDLEHSLPIVLDYFISQEKQDRAIEILHFKMNILWSILDALTLEEPMWKLAPGFRFQWEPSQNAHVLLYPEGMIVLNATAAEILSYCQEASSYQDLLRKISHEYESKNENELEENLKNFLQEAKNHGWLQIKTSPSI